MADSSSESQMQKQDEVYWLPLESDPASLTKYLQSLSQSSWYLIDIPSIDLVDELGIFEFHQIIAYIFLFTVDKHADLGEVDQDVERTKNLFFMKQLIHNSCGSVALFHAYLNTISPEKMTKDSFIEKFYMENINKTPEERGIAFAQKGSIYQLQHDTALLGQSQLPNSEQLTNLNLHFVAFVPHNGSIYELDGRREGPVNHGPTDEQKFKHDALKIMKQYMQMDPDNLNFAILALCSSVAS